MLEIQNRGQEIVSTNYWDTPHARAGYLYLSGNAGAWRVLVPSAAGDLIAEMRTGKTAVIEPSVQEPGLCWDVVFEDGTGTPFSVAVDRRQVDRKIEAGRCVLSVWTRVGKILELPCEVRT